MTVKKSKSFWRRFFSFRNLLFALTIALVIYVVYQNRGDISQAWEDLKNTNVIVLLLLIPEQLYMYYALGQIFFSYFKKNPAIKKLSWQKRLRISTELNFINHAIPAGGVGGLTFLTFRFRPFNITAGQSSFLYIFRYAITTVINYIQALIAVIILAALDKIPPEATWVIWVALIMNIGVFLILSLIIFVASGKKRLDFFSKCITNFANAVVRIITFNHKKTALNYSKINKYFLDIHESLEIAKKDKKSLKSPILWGIVYSLFEIGTYWIVAISLGAPELLPYIMIGEAIGSAFDGIVPYGLYELGMAGVMVALGVDTAIAAIVVVMTRVMTLIFTILTGLIPYRKAIMHMGEKEKNA